MSITRQQALDCLASDDLIGIGLEADALRRTLHPEGVVTYVVTEPAGDPLEAPANDITAALTIGLGETPTQFLDQLETIHTLQAQSAPFAAFTLHTASGPTEPTAVEYLKTLAICRLYLDNIPNIQTSAAVGPKVLQMCLRFGANDIGAIPHHQKHATEEDLRRIIRDAGFQPIQRDPLYRTMFLN